jgi:hypothetical protein
LLLASALSADGALEMKRLRRTAYQTPEEIEEKIKPLEAAAALMPPGEPQQLILVRIAQLRNYAEVKRWCAPAMSGAGHTKGMTRVRPERQTH